MQSSLKVTFKFAFILFLAAFSSLDVSAKEKVENGKPVEDVFLQVSLSSTSAYVGEMVMYELAVYSPVRDLGVIPQPPISFGGLDSKMVKTSFGYSPVKVNGREMYRTVLGRFWLSSSKSGKYTIPSFDFEFTIPREQIVRDPFFGNMRAVYQDVITTVAPAISLKVEELPKVPASFPFSGAIGEYEVNVWIPEGYIKEGEEAIAIVNISGDGDLSNAEVPSLLKAFSGTVRLKSVSEDVSQYVKDGRIGSDMELEVTFIPHPDADGVCRIGEVEFGYYSPSKRKYLKAVSSPVDVPLGSSSRNSAPPVSIGV